MATNIANLRIQLSASTKGLQTPLKNAKKDISGFRDSVNKSSAGLGRMAVQLGAAAVGFLAVRRVIGSVSTSLEKLDSIGKVSDRIGITAEALQKMRFAGELTGVTISTMDTSLLKFRKTTAEAATTSKSLNKALGLVVGETKGFIDLPFETQMKRFADGLKKVENQAERVRLVELFLGRGGRDLLTTLQGGSDQLADMFAQADRAGIFSTQDVRQAEAANDAMLRVSKTLEFITGQFAIQIAPALEKMATALQDMGLTGEGAGKAIGDGVDGATLSMMKGQIGLLQLEKSAAELVGNKSLADEAEFRMRGIEKRIADRKKRIDDALKGKPDPDPDPDPTPSAGLGALLQPSFKAAGSVAAFSAIQGAARKDRFSEMIDAQKAQEDEQKKTNEKLTSIDRKLTPVVPAIV